MDKFFNKKVILSLLGVIAICLLAIWLLVSFNRNILYNQADGIIGITYDGRHQANAGAKGRRIFQEEISVEGIESIAIESDISDIVVTSGETKMLQVEYQAYDNSDFQVVKEGDKIRIIANCANKIRKPEKVKLIIQCPTNYGKDWKIRSNVGSLSLKGDYREIDMASDVGSVEVVGSAQKIIFDSSIGSFEGKGSFDSAEIKSSVGSVDLKTDTITDGSYLIETDMGSIDLTIPKEADVSLTAQTKMGDVDCQARFDSIDQISGNVGKKLKVQNKSGRAMIDLNAETGSITIRH